jgi:predicted enzyme related to lactoylglutathione lyase
MKPVAHYITVSNMKASLEFYAQVFGQGPSHIDDRYSWFEIDGFSFGLLNSDFENREVIYGNAAAMCFLVDDIEAEYARLKDIVPKIDDELMELPTVRVFQFNDHDGNLIEVFQRR